MKFPTKIGEEFLLVSDDVSNIIMFSTETNLKFLVKCDAILMDGTFYSTPKLFSQIFIVHGRRKHTYVPLAFFLLSGKTSDCYARALKKLKTFLPSTFTPRIVFVDFERAIHLAVEEVWLTALLLGCRFHLSQAWFRKIQTLGLTKMYRSKSAEGSYLRSFFGLAFVRPEDMHDFFTNDFTLNEPSDHKVHEFTNYVYDNYISPTARFPPSLWSKYSASVCRTTNACESLHSHLNGMFYHSHPDIFSAIDAFLEIQENSYTIMLSTDMVQQRNASLQKEIYVQGVMDEFENGTIDMMTFVKKVSRKFLPGQNRS